MTLEVPLPRKLRPLLLGALLASLWAVACSRGIEADGSAAPYRPAVRPGLEVLLSDSIHLISGRRVGLITNHTALAGDGRHAIDLLSRAPGVELVALFSPEHGIRGRAEGEVASGFDPATGLPIHSLYGETRAPTPSMLEGLDVLVFDIQDIGARYYTYVSTMALAMAAAGENGIPFVVLDRPNPIGGALVQGNVLDPAFASFVGMYPVAMRHGLTVAELARLFASEHGVTVELHVVPMEGWRRSMWFDETDLTWVPPSPNMPDLESAAHYPGTCLFEGTNVSVGRGTDRAFQQFGAPWLDGETLARRLNASGLAGVRFEPVTFTPREPGDRKFADRPVRGVRLTVTDRERYDPTLAGVAALVEARRLAGERWEWEPAHFDRLAGTDRLRRAIEEGRSPGEITATWFGERANYDRERRATLLYRD